ncbi:MAG: glycine zipper 2TM domain-containing protein [Candidatus Andeanibacterium colombiense]|uniref:17 kDa surface antigen n=1 Tax=Candidatus Andeanibacterium colombiense TaxID=3121345 RepID=A0AAJ5X6I1_9SPHN|nr:MAG: glycine zipper 2TM domain-containing protein [Sphingomonadaceae bacterium]
MKKLFIATAAAAVASMTLAAGPAAAERPYSSHSYERGSYQDYNYGRAGYDRGYDRGYSEYDNRGRYREPRRIGRNDRVWRGNDGNYYCQRDNGTTGLIIGAAGGALLGRAVDTHGERTTGTILGAVLGGLLGKSVDQNNARCR